MCKGFPVEKVPPAEVPYLFIFATGTGIGPIKALIESDTLKVILFPFQSRGQILCIDSGLSCTPLQQYGSMLPSMLSAMGVIFWSAGKGEAADKTVLWDF